MMKTKTYVPTLLAASLIILVGCPTSVVPPPVTPVPPVITDQAKCQLACDNLQRLGCEEGKPIDMRLPCLINAECASGQTCSVAGSCTASCVTFCVDTENQGVWLDPTCVAGITACNQVDSCPLAQQPKPTACAGSGNVNLCTLLERR